MGRQMEREQPGASDSALFGEPGDAVLVVDDSRADLRVVEECLKPLELPVRGCMDAFEAMAGLYEEQFAIALIDVRMPGTDGFGLASEIRRHPRASQLPILFVTGDQLSREEVRLAYSLKAVDVVSKPFLPEVLRTKVEVFVELERRRRADAMRRDLEELVVATAQSTQEPVRAVNRLLRELHDALAFDEGNVQDLMEVARGEALRANSLMKGLLQFAQLRLDPEAAVDLDLSEPIGEVLGQLGDRLDEVGGTIEVGDIPRVHAHAAQLCDLLRELTENAIQFRGRKPLRIRIRGTRMDGEVLVSVEDNGVGIPGDCAEHLFGMPVPEVGPHSARPTGPRAGMGLALARRIVHLNGGRIWCEANEDGIGTRFAFTLPEALDSTARGAR